MKTNILFCNIESNHEYKTYPAIINPKDYSITMVSRSYEIFSYTVFRLFSSSDESYSELILFPDDVVVCSIYENFFGEYGECEVFFTFPSETDDDFITNVLQKNSLAFSNHNSSLLQSVKKDDFFMNYTNFDSVESSYSLSPDSLLNLFWVNFYRNSLFFRGFELDTPVFDYLGRTGKIIHFLLDGSCKVVLQDGTKTIFKTPLV